MGKNITVVEIYKVEIVVNILRIILIYRTCRKILRTSKKYLLNKIDKNFCKHP